MVTITVRVCSVHTVITFSLRGILMAAVNKGTALSFCRTKTRMFSARPRSSKLSTMVSNLYFSCGTSIGSCRGRFDERLTTSLALYPGPLFRGAEEKQKSRPELKASPRSTDLNKFFLHTIKSLITLECDVEVCGQVGGRGVLNIDCQSKHGT